MKIAAALALVLLAGACAAPAPSPSFHDLQARQSAVQAALNDPAPGASHTWQGTDGGGTAAVLGAADGEGCKRLRVTTSGDARDDLWCPTAHGFWVHPEEMFYRHATGRETYGGAVRSGGADGGASAATGSDRPSQADCLELFHEADRQGDMGHGGARRANMRDFHRCLQQSR